MERLTLPVKLAAKLALRSPHHQQRHAAIVLKGGAVLALGYNHDSRHAEAVALGKLWPSKRRGATLLSLRLKPSGSIGLAKPCRRCEKLCREAGLARVYFSTASGDVERLL